MVLGLKKHHASFFQLEIRKKNPPDLILTLSPTVLAEMSGAIRNPCQLRFHPVLNSVKRILLH